MSSQKSAKRKAPAKKRAARSYHHGDLRRALIDAARALVEKEGVAAMSLRAAAREAGVSQTAPYHHFKDKNALLAAIAAEGFKEFDAAMRAFMAKAGDDPYAKLIESGVAYVKFGTDHPALFKLMFGSVVERYDSFPDLAEAGDRAFNTLLENVKAVMAEERGGAQSTKRTAQAKPSAAKTGPHPEVRAQRASKDGRTVAIDDEAALTAALSEWSRVHGLATLLVDGGLNPQRYPKTDAEALARAVLGKTAPGPR